MTRLSHANQDLYRRKMHAVRQIVRQGHRAIRARYGDVNGARSGGIWLPYHHVGHNVAVGRGSFRAGWKLAEQGLIDPLDLPALGLSGGLHDDIQGLLGKAANEKATAERLRRAMWRYRNVLSRRDQQIGYKTTLATTVLGFDPVLRQMYQQVDPTEPMTLVITDNDVDSIRRRYGVRDSLRLFIEFQFPLDPSKPGLLGPDGEPVDRPRSPAELTDLPLEADAVRRYLIDQMTFFAGHQFAFSDPESLEQQEDNSKAFAAFVEHFDNSITEGEAAGTVYGRLLAAADHFALTGVLPLNLIPEAGRIAPSAETTTLIAAPEYRPRTLTPEQRLAGLVRIGALRLVRYEALPAVEAAWRGAETAYTRYDIPRFVREQNGTNTPEVEQKARRRLLATMRGAVTTIERILTHGVTRGPYALPIEVGVVDGEAVDRFRAIVEGLAKHPPERDDFRDVAARVVVNGEEYAAMLPGLAEHLPELDTLARIEGQEQRALNTELLLSRLAETPALRHQRHLMEMGFVAVGTQMATAAGFLVDSTPETPRLFVPASPAMLATLGGISTGQSISTEQLAEAGFEPTQDPNLFIRQDGPTVVLLQDDTIDVVFVPAADRLQRAVASGLGIVGLDGPQMLLSDGTYDCAITPDSSHITVLAVHTGPLDNRDDDDPEAGRHRVTPPLGDPDSRGAARLPSDADRVAAELALNATFDAGSDITQARVVEDRLTRALRGEIVAREERGTSEQGERVSHSSHRLLRDAAAELGRHVAAESLDRDVPAAVTRATEELDVILRATDGDLEGRLRTSLHLGLRAGATREIQRSEPESPTQETAAEQPVPPSRESITRQIRAAVAVSRAVAEIVPEEVARVHRGDRDTPTTRVATTERVVDDSQSPRTPTQPARVAASEREAVGRTSEPTQRPRRTAAYDQRARHSTSADDRPTQPETTDPALPARGSRHTVHSRDTGDEVISVRQRASRTASEPDGDGNDVLVVPPRRLHEPRVPSRGDGSDDQTVIRTRDDRLSPEASRAFVDDVTRSVPERVRVNGADQRAQTTGREGPDGSLT